MAPKNSTGATNSSDDANSNRNSTFQILADGSLDLTTLIALFATGSVEGCALDYTQGLVAAAAAPLLLLGILGSVKALSKLSIGPEFCDGLGFGTEGLRPNFGLPKSDITTVSSSELVQIVYLERVSSSYGSSELRYHWTLGRLW